jgi:hypothetical protein
LPIEQTKLSSAMTERRGQRSDGSKREIDQGAQCSPRAMSPLPHLRLHRAARVTTIIGFADEVRDGWGSERILIDDRSRTLVSSPCSAD